MQVPTSCKQYGVLICTIRFDVVRVGMLIKLFLTESPLPEEWWILLSESFSQFRTFGMHSFDKLGLCSKNGVPYFGRMLD
jgi:hypothetical protein